MTSETPNRWIIRQRIERLDNGQCPNCGADLQSGYGFAFGGGIGFYVNCENFCGYYEKSLDPPDEE